jgi:hypothetical protein
MWVTGWSFPSLGGTAWIDPSPDHWLQELALTRGTNEYPVFDFDASCSTRRLKVRSSSSSGGDQNDAGRP